MQIYMYTPHFLYEYIHHIYIYRAWYVFLHGTYVQDCPTSSHSRRDMLTLLHTIKAQRFAAMSRRTRWMSWDAVGGWVVLEGHCVSRVFFFENPRVN